MAANSSIEWTHHTFNPWWGCTRVSPGCINCYAEVWDRRISGLDNAHWGVKSPRRFFGDKHWEAPIRWNNAAAKAGVRARVFCASMADLFEDRPDLVAPRLRTFLLIQNTPWLDWLLLTKRTRDILRLVPEEWLENWPSNVWMGTTVEDQPRAQERIPELLEVPAPVRFLSCEPLLSAVDLTTDGLGIPSPDGFISTLHGPVHELDGAPRIHWVIAGGESGHHARPMHPEWVRGLRDQCDAADVAFLFKQWGEHLPGGCNLGGPTWPHGAPGDDRWITRTAHFFTEPTEEYAYRVGKHNAGRLLDGTLHDGFPSPATHV